MPTVPMAEGSPLIDPRIQGIHEHYGRANGFIGNAFQHDAAKFRLLLTAVYSCRACVEIMLTAVEQGQHPAYQEKDQKKMRDSFEKTLAPKLPRYNLLEKIRIHDFHRFGLVPPDPRVNQLFSGGPMKLSAAKGVAGLVEGSMGPEKTVTGNSFIKEQRALRIQNGQFYDDDAKEYVTLERVVLDFFRALPPILAEFEAAISGAGPSSDSKPAPSPT